MQAVDATLERIAQWPQIGQRVTGVSADVPVRKAPLNRFPYHVIYLEWEGVIRILAFAHDHREPGYWLSAALTTYDRRSPASAAARERRGLASGAVPC